MRLLHTGDLHIGKRLHEVSLLEDQQFILQEIRRLARAHQVDALVIAGDVYDKTLPPAEAVSVLDAFFTDMWRDGIPVLLVSGNHDSPERLGFASRLLTHGGLHIATELKADPQPWSFSDGKSRVQIWPLPFVRPASARAALGDESLLSYEQAVRAMLARMQQDADCCQVLLAHQFVVSGSTEPERCDSEQLSIGGVDQVDVSAFSSFDYVALGHLHGPQQVGRPTVRYSGSPLQYSFSELNHHKSAVLVELGPGHQVKWELLPLQPLRRLRQIRGPLQQLISPEVVSAASAEDYIRAILTDEEDLLHPMDQLRRVYPHIMQMLFENSRSGPGLQADSSPAQPEKDPLTHFCDFYLQQQGVEASEEKRSLVRKLLAQIGEERL